MVPAIIVAEKYRRMKGVFLAAVAALVASQIMLYFGAGDVFFLLAALVVFFSAFNVMEASLPSLITKVAPPQVKGTAMGVYSSLQFLGIFTGGIIGGMAHQHGGSAGVFVLTTALSAVWLLAALGMVQPSYLTTRLLPVADDELSDASSLAVKLRQVPGVVEAVIIAEENVAYLKVDAKSFDAAMAQAVVASASAR
jgi:MFS family permease